MLVCLPLLTRTYRAMILCTLLYTLLLCFSLQYMLGHVWVPIIPCRFAVNEPAQMDVRLSAVNSPKPTTTRVSAAINHRSCPSKLCVPSHPLNSSLIPRVIGNAGPGVRRYRDHNGTFSSREAWCLPNGRKGEMDNVNVLISYSTLTLSSATHERAVCGGRGSAWSGRTR